MPSDRLCRFARIDRETPYAAFDLDAVEDAYDDYLTALDGRGRVQFAVKARPEPRLLAALVRRGASLDVASTAEIRLALQAGCPPERLSHSNIVRDEAEIAAAAELGVRLFTADSAAEITRLDRAAPGVSVLLRLACAPGGAQLPMSSRFGCGADEAVALADLAETVGLRVAGLTWQVGSQQTDPARWRSAIAHAARVWMILRAKGFRGLRILNVGGGMPASYRLPVPSIRECATVIRAAIGEHFGTEDLDVVVEPGRSLVAEAGITVTRVKAVLDRGERAHLVLDAGIWNAGLTECLVSGLEFPVHTLDHPAGAPTRPVVLCGPSCDPLDELRAENPYHLPVALAPGDRLLIGSTGAYCATMATTDFCGYPPVPQHTLTARLTEASR
ncbi:ornithine decarboxylase [Nocardia sp. SSK8]|uniref:ornithine decarboxylase n=1 Tax=Nocardia sp. SSK8 TaxID=3120154 RepID=UPI00300BD375